MENKISRTDWKKVQIGEICNVVRGGSPRPMGDPKYFSGNIPFIKIGDITSIKSNTIFDSAIHVNKEGTKKSRLLPKGSLILSNSGTVCIPKFLGVDACIHDGFVSFINLQDFVLKHYLFHFFHYLRPYVIEKHKQGVTQVNLNTTIVSEFQLHLPPLPEQRAIVSKIEQLFSDLDNGIDNFKKALEQLKIYRQAVLKKAFEGDLTKKWREEQADLPSAEELLRQVKKEREKHYQKQLDEWKQAVKDWEDNSKEGKKPGKPKKSKELPPLTEEKISELPELPEGWCWVKVDKLLEHDPYSIKAGPFGSALKKKFYVKSGYKIYGQEQVISGNPYLGDYYIDNNKYNELFSCAIKPQDVLISLVGTVGKVLILPDNIESGIINPRLIKISLNRSFYNTVFFKYYFESLFLKSLYKINAHGATMEIINLGIIQDLPFPFCSIEEQHQIVSKIETRLSICDKMEETITESLEKAESLRQSILKKAFEGKLLNEKELEEARNAPDWEPAEKLVERIRQEKQIKENNNKPTRRKTHG